MFRTRTTKHRPVVVRLPILEPVLARRRRDISPGRRSARMFRPRNEIVRNETRFVFANLVRFAVSERPTTVDVPIYTRNTRF